MKYKAGDKVKLISNPKEFTYDTHFGKIETHTKDWEWLKEWYGKEVMLDTANEATGLYTAVEIKGHYLTDDLIEELTSLTLDRLVETATEVFNGPEKDVRVVEDNDYWERLRHQAAISAMQAIMSNPVGFESLRSQHIAADKKVAEVAVCYANELVKGLKISRSN